MGGLPTSKEGLEAAGYLFDNEGYCRACHAPIEWWICPPKRRADGEMSSAKMPMDVVPVRDGQGFFAPVKEWKRIPHWASCSHAKDFRRSRT
jgi:hypothetical protein